MDLTYRNTLEIARAEFEQLANEESELESRLQMNRTRQSGLKKTIESLSALVGEDDPDGTITGITEAIRSVLRTQLSQGKKFYLSPVGIRNRLIESGFDTGSYKNPLAVIHTTLKRLQEQNEIESVEGKDKKVGYRWIERNDYSAGITDDDVPF